MPGVKLSLPDTITDLAMELDKILHPRDAAIFYPEDKEGFSSMSESRPYNIERSVLR